MEWNKPETVPKDKPIIAKFKGSNPPVFAIWDALDNNWSIAVICNGRGQCANSRWFETDVKKPNQMLGWVDVPRYNKPKEK